MSQALVERICETAMPDRVRMIALFAITATLIGASSRHAFAQSAGQAPDATLAHPVAREATPATVATAVTHANADPAQDPEPTPPPLRFSGRRLYWDPSFDRMDAPEMIFTGVTAAVAVTTYILPPLHTGWQGGILIDDQVRSIRAPTYEGQLEARTYADLGLALITTYPILVDSVLVAYWYRGSDDVALQMALIDGEAIALTGALQGASNVLAGRARPYASECGKTIPANTTDCQTTSVDRSFFSGHTSGAFTAAGLICAHHEALQLYESAADPLTCAGAMLLAATVGTLRIIGDAHYFSDVVVGAVVGTSVGLGIPLLHHYKRAPQGGSATSFFHLALVPGPNGAQLVGIF